MTFELVSHERAADLDDRLALAARDGEREAFDTLVRRYEDRLLRFAYRMLQDTADAEDVIQCTFIRAYKALRSYRPGSQFGSWLYSIALNECRRRAKKVRSQRTLPEEAAANVAMEGIGDPASNALNRDRNRRIKEAVMALPAHYREAILLFYFEEFSVEEMATALGISITAAKVRLHRARAKLSSVLKDEL